MPVSKTFLLLPVVLLLAACGGQPSSPASQNAAKAVSVLYAGSLVNLMEKGIGPAFQRDTGVAYQGQGGGSVALANAIRDKTKSGDVFISADTGVNQTLMGAANGDWLRADAVFARTALVIGYSPKSKFAADLEKAKAGSLLWYQVLQEPGLKLGRTDPELDPKGYRTLFLFDLAQLYYHQPDLRQRILGSDNNPEQVFPEETLETRLESGALDAGIFYTNEAAEKGLPYISLPDELNQSNPEMAQLYAKASYTNAKGQTFRGGPIVYTAGALTQAKDPAAAALFVQYLFSPPAQAVMKDHGLLASPVLYQGDKNALPAGVQPLVKGEYPT
jgi:molybdate/tungstate transport system substrate-binding protein